MAHGDTMGVRSLWCTLTYTMVCFVFFLHMCAPSVIAESCNIKQTVNSSNTPSSVLLLGSHHKSGTEIAANLLSFLNSSISIPPLRSKIKAHRLPPNRLLCEALPQEKVPSQILGLWHFNKGVLADAQRAARCSCSEECCPRECHVHAIHFMRDPFHMIVSGYEYHKLTSETWATIDGKHLACGQKRCCEKWHDRYLQHGSLCPMECD